VARVAKGRVMSIAPIISVYDGQRLLGHITERAPGRHIARTWPDEVKLGTFRTRREAADAISLAARRCRRTA
jgi:hypothetical protein